MSESSAVDLLREALTLLRQRTAATAPDGPTQTDRMLAARIDRFLADYNDRQAGETLLREARDRWKDEPAIRVDESAVLSADARGLWVSGWLHLGAPRAPIDPDAFNAALASLPHRARAVYLLNQRDGLDYVTIATRLGLSPPEVEHELSIALGGLHRHIHGARS